MRSVRQREKQDLHGKETGRREGKGCVMHYYTFNIGDYISHTRHLTPIEDLVYRRMLDLYYLHEQPLNERLTVVARAINMRDYEDDVAAVLEEFFELIDGKGWVNPRCEEEISRYQSKVAAASRAGKASAERRRNDRSTDVQPTNNQEPITNNQEKKEKVPKRKFVPPTLEEVRAYCQERANQVDPERFIDHYQSNGWMVGKTKMKDWKAAIRNWEKRDETNRAAGGRQESAYDRRKRVRDQLRAEAMRWVDPDQVG